MKQKDIALIVVIAAISAVISVFASKALFSTPKGLSAQVETVEKISADFPQPDTRYFNEKSINPTTNISIGDSNNNDPFKK